MLTRSKSLSKVIIAVLIIAALIISTVSPVFAVHNRLRQGTVITTTYNPNWIVMAK